MSTVFNFLLQYGHMPADAQAVLCPQPPPLHLLHIHSAWNPETILPLRLKSQKCPHCSPKSQAQLRLAWAHALAWLFLWKKETASQPACPTPHIRTKAQTHTVPPLVQTPTPKYVHQLSRPSPASAAIHALISCIPSSRPRPTLPTLTLTTTIITTITTAHSLPACCVSAHLTVHSRRATTNASTHACTALHCSCDPHSCFNTSVPSTRPKLVVFCAQSVAVYSTRTVTSAYTLTCTQVHGPTYALTVERASASQVHLRSIGVFTLASGHTRAPTVVGASPTWLVSGHTSAYTPVRSHTSVRSVERVLHSRVPSRSICVYIQARGPLFVACAARASQTALGSAFISALHMALSLSPIP